MLKPEFPQIMGMLTQSNDARYACNLETLNSKASLNADKKAIKSQKRKFREYASAGCNPMRIKMLVSHVPDKPNAMDAGSGSPKLVACVVQIDSFAND